MQHFFAYLPGISDDNKVENSCQIISQNVARNPNRNVTDFNFQL